ncbi:MAG: PilZ domain-containing protein [Gaiellales bacterium]
MSRVSPSQAVSILVTAPSQELEVEGGGRLSLYAQAVSGTRVHATAPRLKVARGMSLIGRLVADDGRPWAVSLTVEKAEFHSEELAAIELRAVRVGLDSTRREAVRVPAGGVAWLSAVSCQHVVDGDRVDGTLTDLSRTGVGFATGRTLRRGDRLMFHGRFFKDEVDAEVRVASVREASTSGRLIVGARFIAIDPENLARVERILAGGVRSQPATLDFESLRDLAAVATGDTGPSRGWRKLFRRD